MSRTIILAGGGTGGHVFPLIAVADALRRIQSNLRIVFIGTERGIEKSLVPARGYELELVQVDPIRGMGAVGALRGIGRAIAALPSSYSLLQRMRPDVILTVGGYAAGPISLAARTSGVPLALLEPNAVIGFANRAIAPWVSRAYTAFPPVDAHFAARKVLRTGVPIRDGFLPSSWCGKSPRRQVLVLGGSQGARTLNEHVPEALARLQSRIAVRHQCGKNDVELVTRRYADLGAGDAEVIPFIDDMPAALREADLVISRSGASAVSEICAVGRASVLVPYPFAAGNHQQRNAEALAASGAACWVHNRDATPSRLAEMIGRLVEDTDALAQLAAKATAFGRPYAATDIANDLLAVAGARPFASSHRAQGKREELSSQARGHRRLAVWRDTHEPKEMN